MGAGSNLYDAVLGGLPEDWELRPHEDALLVAAAHTADEIERLESALAEVDPVVTGSKGQERAHPLIAEVRAHRLALRALLGSLHLAEPEGENAGHAGRQLARERWS